jgi:tetratricopeptide (TPR) repeat protein
MKLVASILAIAGLLALSMPVSAQESRCGSIAETGTGPFDYRRGLKRQGYIGDLLDNVNGAHFQPYAENLIRGRFHAYPVGPAEDINYVLSVFPNHHRALASIARLSARLKTMHPTGLQYALDCVFDRAARIAPDDGMVPMLYGTYFAGIGDFDKALELYKKAEEMMPSSVNVAYNMGLLYADMQNYDQAIAYARKAYANGVKLPGLKGKLVKAGKWPAGADIPADPTMPPR